MRNLGIQRKKFREKPHPLIEWDRKQDIRSWRQTRRNGYFSIKKYDKYKIIQAQNIQQVCETIFLKKSINNKYRGKKKTQVKVTGNAFNEIIEENNS